MSNNHLPEGWGKQQSIIPDNWAAQSTENIAAKTKPTVETVESQQSAKTESTSSDPPVKCEDIDNSKVCKDSFINDAVPEKSDNNSVKYKKTKPSVVLTVIIAITLTVAVAFLIVILVLYFGGKKDNQKKDDTKAAAVETTVTQIFETTEKPTEVSVTEVPITTSPTTVQPTTTPIVTVEPTTAKPKEEEQSPNSFESYLVWLDEDVYVREEPNRNATVTYRIDISTKYTIVDETNDDYGNLWGKLKSGIGWVNLTEATDGNQNQRISASRRYYMNNPYMEYRNVGNIVFCYYPVYPVEQMTPIEEGIKKITSFTAEKASENIYNLHITGEYQTNDEAKKRVCCFEMDCDLQTITSHFISDPVLNERFEINTSISISSDTEVINIDLV